jgi:hypothetical protein
LKTFSTGEFEFLAVPPGSYAVILDPTDLRTIGIRTQVPERDIVVGVKPEGDQIEGINFELRQQ